MGNQWSGVATPIVCEKHEKCEGSGDVAIHGKNTSVKLTMLWLSELQVFQESMGNLSSYISHVIKEPPTHFISNFSETKRWLI